VGTAAEEHLLKQLDAAVKKEVRAPGPWLGAVAPVLAKRLLTRVNAQDYTAASRLKAELQELQGSDPVLLLRARLSSAVASERWAEASALRDELRVLEPPPPPPPQPQRVPCSSSRVSHGVRVSVRSSYLPARSEAGSFLFRYDVTVRNEGDAPVQLLNRHWVITDSTGRTDHVRGQGVVGQQPLLAPGQSFSYSSFCPMRTPRGTMHGAFGFLRNPDLGVAAADDTERATQRAISVLIARFGCDVRGLDVEVPGSTDDTEA